MHAQHRHLIAILRGITATEVAAVCRVLVDAGITLIEIPLNSLRPLQSIRVAIEALASTRNNTEL